jgi:hypothetical protein
VLLCVAVYVCIIAGLASPVNRSYQAMG